MWIKSLIDRDLKSNLLAIWFLKFWVDIFSDFELITF